MTIIFFLTRDWNTAGCTGRDDSNFPGYGEAEISPGKSESIPCLSYNAKKVPAAFICSQPAVGNRTIWPWRKG